MSAFKRRHFAGEVIFWAVLVRLLRDQLLRPEQ
jgi:hypothetical protein